MISLITILQTRVFKRDERNTKNNKEAHTEEEKGRGRAREERIQQQQAGGQPVGGWERNCKHWWQDMYTGTFGHCMIEIDESGQNITETQPCTALCWFNKN